MKKAAFWGVSVRAHAHTPKCGGLPRELPKSLEKARDKSPHFLRKYQRTRLTGVYTGVIDANIAVRTALEISESLEVFWNKVDNDSIIPCAPRLWMSETTSAVRSLLAQKQITADEAQQAFQTIHRLGIEIIDEDQELCQRALELAGKLGQSKVYDAIYLALAEKLAADFWTADERLANRGKDLNLPWIHSINEINHV